jgi:hypothetical protein
MEFQRDDAVIAYEYNDAGDGDGGDLVRLHGFVSEGWWVEGVATVGTRRATGSALE